MADFRYNGDHKNFAYYGAVFRVDGEDLPVDITDEDKIAKLRTNSHFDEVDAEPKTSASMNVGPAVKVIEGIETLEELKVFAAEDKRPGVVKAADAKAAELQPE